MYNPIKFNLFLNNYLSDLIILKKYYYFIIQHNRHIINKSKALLSSFNKIV